MLIIRKKEGGFTLIELIVTLVLLGLMAVFGGMLLVKVAEGYIFARLNAETVQKTQLAVTRLTKEFAAIREVTSANDTSITYQRPDVFVGTKTVTVALSGSLLQLDNSTLTDSVSSFTLHYCAEVDDDLATCASVWGADSRMIAVELVMSGAAGTTSTFTTRITPRNL